MAQDRRHELDQAGLSSPHSDICLLSSKPNQTPQPTMKLIVATSAVALLASQVHAHGYLSQPAAYFPNGIDTSYNGILTESCDAAFGGLKWNDSPEANTAMFTKSFPNSQFKTLKAMMDTAAPDCGKTSLTGKAPVDVSSLKSMTWQNDQEQKGFIDSHRGPCEGWIDDTRVFHSDDCRGDYTGYPAEIPVDFSSCSGDCTFTFYWLALHEPNWQVYKQCAAITNGSGGGAQTQTTDAPTTQTETTDAPSSPTATTQTPTTTDAPAATSTPTTTEQEYPSDASTANEGDYTPAPAAGTVAPADVTDAPASTSTANCKRRRRMTANLRSEN
ncbi:hypothetical protein DVH05_022524 [Phytophthora capsici]|nr:hypothetical protein DVH05_022524 [Phytophthora capsici]